MLGEWLHWINIQLGSLPAPILPGILYFIFGAWFGGIFTAAKQGNKWGATWRAFALFVLLSGHALDPLEHIRFLELTFILGFLFAARPFITGLWNWIVDLLSAFFRVLWQIIHGLYSAVEALAILAARIVSYAKLIPGVRPMTWKESAETLRDSRTKPQSDPDDTFSSHSSNGPYSSTSDDDMRREQERRAEDMRRQYEQQDREKERQESRKETGEDRESWDHKQKTHWQRQSNEEDAEQARRNAEARRQSERDRQEREASRKRHAEEATRAREEQARQEKLRREQEAADNPVNNYDAAIRYFGLDPNRFTEEDLKQAYKKKMLALHPDKWGGLPDRVRIPLEEEAKIVNLARDLIKSTIA